MGEAVRRALHFGRQISCVFAKYPKCAHTKCLPADIHSFISARHFSNATFKCCLKSVPLRGPTCVSQYRISHHTRCFSDHIEQRVPLGNTDDPVKLTEKDLSTLCDAIKLELNTKNKELQTLSHYLFDGKGKSFRPMVVLLCARACNIHAGSNSSNLKESQRRIAMIAEMLHTASLIHDDVIDSAETRRGKSSVHHKWGEKKAIVTGDYVLSVSSQALARIGNSEVVVVLSQVVEDLVRGEFMQLGSKEDENERFAHYLKKTYKKTASLIANSCKAVAILGECEPEVVEVAYQYGRNVGLAFQLVDDMLDFISSEQMLGKPAAADLKLGLATAPVLFAAQGYPELKAMIMRRFTFPGDVERARHLVAKSDGVGQTRMLAEQHGRVAMEHIQQLTSSREQQALIKIIDMVLKRLK